MLHSFAAHTQRVNALHLGPKSHSVIATAADDKKVNLWDAKNCSLILSLSGHTSPVESVNFDPNEHTVVAGSAGGTLKLWDLNQGRVARTLTGHRSNCLAAKWHPLADFFAYPSWDWDQGPSSGPNARKD